MKTSYVHRDGVKLDKQLLEAFGDSVKGRGDGRVSAGDVKAEITKRAADAGRLTDTELATIDYAVHQYHVTGAGLRELSSLISDLTGKEVFAWQRDPSLLNVQIDPSKTLSRQQLQDKAVDWVLHNVQPFYAADNSYLLPHLGSGNNGTDHYLVSGAAAMPAVNFMAAWNVNNKSVLEEFDPATQGIIYTQLTGDEPEYALSVIDTRTGEVTYIDDVNLVDTSYVIKRDAFEKIMGKSFTHYYDGDREQIEAELAGAPTPQARDELADEYYEEIDSFMLHDALREGGVHLPIYTGLEADHPNTLATRAAGRAWVAAKDALGEGRNWGVTVDAYFDTLPYVDTNELADLARSMYVASNTGDYKVEHSEDAEMRAIRPVGDALADEIANVIVRFDPRENGASALPNVTKSLNQMFDELGPLNELQAFAFDAAPPKRDGPGTAEAHAYIVVNEQTGNYGWIYTREKVD